MSKFADLKAEYIALAGKNPPPMSADALEAKVAELKAAAAAKDLPQDPPAQDPPAQDPPAQDPPAQDPPAQDPPAQNEAADEQSVEDACDELGLSIEDGQCAIEMLTGLCGPDVNLVRGDPHCCDAAEAVRLVRAGYASPR